MVTKKEIRKCTLCGSIAEVLQDGSGEMVCCGQPMQTMNENATDAAREKHIPMIEQINDNGYIVTVGVLPHPMEAQHHIEWIEFIADNKSYRCFLKPGEPPRAYFCVQADAVASRAYCNLHGLWGG